MASHSPCAVPSTTTAPLIPDEIVPNLYLSDLSTAAAVLSPNYNAPGLNRPKIKYILSIVNKPERQPKIPPGRESEFVMKMFVMRDMPTSNLLAILPEACAFIVNSMNNEDGGVLVHCHKGISRSAAVVIAVLMHDRNKPYSQTLQFVRGRRPNIWPNAGFQKQLILWHVMNFRLYDDDGKENRDYARWKIENETEIQQLESPGKGGAQNGAVAPSSNTT